MAAIYYRYQTEIKVYLFSKNMCLWFFAEEDIDKNKTYDVFMSYSHKDAGFVIDELLRELECPDNAYKVCIHERDWMPGECITKQTVASVRESKRTLIVLSENFMESDWGILEFRIAHSVAVSERRTRLIVILYGDFDTSELDEELKSYLKTNTYLKWGDSYFWKKLKYALPHRKCALE